MVLTTTAVASPDLYTVDGGQRNVLFDRFHGVIDNTVGEGTHFLIPWLQIPYIYGIRTRPHTFSLISGTKDLQMVNLTLRVLSRPKVNRLPSIFRILGLEYDRKVLPSVGDFQNPRSRYGLGFAMILSFYLIHIGLAFSFYLFSSPPISTTPSEVGFILEAVITGGACGHFLGLQWLSLTRDK
ncbi:hypothetical protein R6Q59_020455 [Mikania micrantha]